MNKLHLYIILFAVILIGCNDDIIEPITELNPQSAYVAIHLNPNQIPGSSNAGRADSSNAESRANWGRDIYIANTFVGLYDNNGNILKSAWTYPKKTFSQAESIDLGLTISSLDQTIGPFTIAVYLNSININAKKYLDGAKINQVTTTPSTNMPSHYVLRYGPKDFSSGSDGSELANTWQAPAMSGMVKGVTITEGINLLGFEKNGDVYSGFTIEKFNTLFGTALNGFSSLNDANQNSTEGLSGRKMMLTCRYSQIYVNSLQCPSSFVPDYIFIMNSPARQFLFGDKTLYTTESDITGSTTLTFSKLTNRSFTYGFKKEWLTNASAEWASHDFKRIVHFPVDAEVSYSTMSSEYTEAKYANNDLELTPNSWQGLICQLSDGQITSIPSGYNDKKSKNTPLFLVFANDGNYETSTYTATENDTSKTYRNYYFATYLVVRGTWTNQDNSQEIVYYPILVNAPHGIGYTAETILGDGVDASEEGSLVKVGRRYIFNINIKGKGNSNPWYTINRMTPIEVDLQINDWNDTNIKLIKHII